MQNARWILLAIVTVSAVFAEGPFDPIAGLSRVGAAPTSLMIVQCNPYYGGKLNLSGDQTKTTWETAEKFAQILRADCPDASVIGEEEVVGLEAAQKMQGFLNKHSGHSWEFAFEEHGINDKGNGLAVHWRTDRVKLVRRLGSEVIGRIDNGYNLRFMGVVLAEKATGRPFGVFCGKLIWAGAVKDGRKVREAERVRQARRVKDWVRKVMAGYPNAPRILTMDMNSTHGSKTYNEFAKEYESDGSKQFTHSSPKQWFGRSIMFKRLDYIWYDADDGAKKTGGFLSPAGRSEHFGSDHRAVWARVKI